MSAERVGLPDLVAQHVRPGGTAGVNAHRKVGCLVAGMVGGAYLIDDMDVLRHGAMGTLSGGVRAPSTLGSPPPGTAAASARSSPAGSATRTRRPPPGRTSRSPAWRHHAIFTDSPFELIEAEGTAPRSLSSSHPQQTSVDRG